jgi:hypothetical protein
MLKRLRIALITSSPSGPLSLVHWSRVVITAAARSQFPNDGDCWIMPSRFSGITVSIAQPMSSGLSNS